MKLNIASFFFLILVYTNCSSQNNHKSRLSYNQLDTYIEEVVDDESILLLLKHTKDHASINIVTLEALEMGDLNSRLRMIMPFFIEQYGPNAMKDKKEVNFSSMDGLMYKINSGNFPSVNFSIVFLTGKELTYIITLTALKEKYESEFINFDSFLNSLKLEQ